MTEESQGEADDVPVEPVSGDPSPAEPGHDEVFCIECGEVIKERAEICPECGVRQQLGGSDPSGPDATGGEPGGPDPGAGGDAGQSVALSDRRRYELEEIANNDETTVMVVGFLLTPVAYWMLGKKALAIVNFLTFNFFLTGPIVVPIHCYVAMKNAREELRRAGVSGY